MSKRERTLATTLGTLAVIILIGFLVIPAARGLLGGGGVLKRQLTEVKSLAAVEPEWSQKHQWLDKNMPTFSSEAIASSNLLERLESLFQSHGIRIENREIKKIDIENEQALGISPHYDRAQVAVELFGDTQKLVQCIHTIQKPKSFTGVDQIVLEPSDKGGVKCKLVVTQWYSGM